MKRVLGVGAKCGCVEPECCDLCCPAEQTDDTFADEASRVDPDVPAYKKGKTK